MKKVLRSSYALFLALGAMFAASTNAWAEDVTTTFNCQTSTVSTRFTSADGQVTLQQTAKCNYESWGADYVFGGHGDHLLLTGDFTFAAPAGKFVKSITMSTGGYQNYNEYTYVCNSGGEFEFDGTNTFTWTGQKESVSFSAPGVWAPGFTSISVTYGDYEEIPTFQFATATPAPGDYAGNLNRMTLVAPEGVTFTGRGSCHYITVNGEKYSYPYGEVSADGRSISFSTGINEGSEGQYTIVIPEEFVKTADGTINEEMTLEYNLSYPYFRINYWGGREPQQSLSSFTVSAPYGVTFTKVQSPVTLQLQGEYNPETWEYDYTDVQATVALNAEGAAVFTFDEPYTEKADLYFMVPQGVISDERGYTNLGFSASFMVDPYQYFALTVEGLTENSYVEGPLTEVVYHYAGDHDLSQLKIKENPVVIFNLNGSDIKVPATATIDAATGNITFSLDPEQMEMIEEGRVNITLPLGTIYFDEYTVNNDIRLSGVNIQSPTGRFGGEADHYNWASISEAETLTFTFGRDLASVDPTKVKFANYSVAYINETYPGAIDLRVDGRDVIMTFGSAIRELGLGDWAQVNVSFEVGAAKATNNTENADLAFTYYWRVFEFVTLDEHGWAAYSAPAGKYLRPDGVTMYTVSGIDESDNTLVLSRYSNSEFRGELGFLFQGTPGAKVALATTDWCENYPANLLKGNASNETITYTSSDFKIWNDDILGEESCKLYHLTFTDGKIGFEAENASATTLTAAPNEAFLAVPVGKADKVDLRVYITNDANGDGMVDVNDVEAAAELLTSGATTGIKSVDTNGDGQVTIGEVTEVIKSLK